MPEQGQEQDRRPDAGISTIEVVILAPLMMLFILVLVALGQLVDGRGAVDSAASNAARAGSLQHDAGAALALARTSAVTDLVEVCATKPVVHKTSAGFESGGLFSVEVTCHVRGLAMLGLNIGTDVTARSSSPIDPYRRAG